MRHILRLRRKTTHVLNSLCDYGSIAQKTWISDLSNESIELRVSWLAKGQQSLQINPLFHFSFVLCFRLYVHVQMSMIYCCWNYLSAYSRLFFHRFSLNSKFSLNSRFFSKLKQNSHLNSKIRQFCGKLVKICHFSL